jgi:hypothetical protein
MPPEPTKALPRYRFEFCNTIQGRADMLCPSAIRRFGPKPDACENGR